MKMQIKGILFDFDGTIANTIDLIIATFEHTCREVLGFTPEREKIVATFGLPLPDKFTLCLCHVAEQLQYDVGDQDAGEVAVLPRIQKRHVQDDDRGLFFFRQYSPLFQYFMIIAAQPVDAFDYQDVSPFQFFHQPFVALPLKILARLLVQDDVFRGHAVFQHRRPLSLLVLFL